MRCVIVELQSLAWEVICQLKGMCIAMGYSCWKCSQGKNLLMTCSTMASAFISLDMALPGGATEIVDHVRTLLGGEEEEAASVSVCLISILGIGVACSKESPRERMDICDAVLEVRSIKDMIDET